MTQHVLLTMVAAPLLVLGAPERLALRAAPRARASIAAALRSRPARALTHPAACWCALPVAMATLHLPGVFRYATDHAWAHHADHALLLCAALLFWFPVAGGELGPRRLSPLGRLAYLFAAMGPMGALGAVLTTTTGPIYPHYAHSAAALGVTPANDQQLAGAVMWVGGGYALVIATLAAVWAALAAEERRARAREAYEDARVAA
jgi:putative copper resistance protein D